ncbi:MAG: hypothetical protein R3F34_14815 [Planctomycetota bacterium]
MWDLGDREGAAIAAAVLERTCPDDVEAWRRLEVYFAQTRNRKRQIEAAERITELESGG